MHRKVILPSPAPAQTTESPTSSTPARPPETNTDTKPNQRFIASAAAQAAHDPEKLQRLINEMYLYEFNKAMTKDGIWYNMSLESARESPLAKAKFSIGQRSSERTFSIKVRDDHEGRMIAPPQSEKRKSTPRGKLEEEKGEGSSTSSSSITTTGTISEIEGEMDGSSKKTSERKKKKNSRKKVKGKKANAATDGRMQGLLVQQEEDDDDEENDEIVVDMKTKAKEGAVRNEDTEEGEIDMGISKAEFVPVATSETVRFHFMHDEDDGSLDDSLQNDVELTDSDDKEKTPMAHSTCTSPITSSDHIQLDENNGLPSNDSVPPFHSVMSSAGPTPPDSPPGDHVPSSIAVPTQNHTTFYTEPPMTPPPEIAIPIAATPATLPIIGTVFPPTPPSVHPLAQSWTLYFSDTSKKAQDTRQSSMAADPHPQRSSTDYSSGLVTIFTASTVEDLLGSWKALRRAIASAKRRPIEALGDPILRGGAGLGLHMMNDDNNFHMFVKGVKPMWEDAMCAKGGKIMIAGDTASMDQTFLEIVLLLIGGTIHDFCPPPPSKSNMICGAVISKRKLTRIEIWLGGKDVPDPEWVRSVTNFFERSFKGVRMYPYKPFGSK
ncbi:hypothetical protein CI109_100542 [Kwoniella shandongensis]|uniref:Uncharacterized protein n=1 Tax=Kwoniella shandongensis TaxID=1734106 RepID=A0A5M6BZD6_9TREE|nr:uncharacterized protein CI109_003537 [Kwoniella shandongensis]KAA5528248.1 hypothetical protein CI109_003537 [Kwoniella shandongensis]